jgi:hypothetical protein
MLLPWLKVNLKQSSDASKNLWPIVPESILHGTLCYFAGGSDHDIHVSCRMYFADLLFSKVLMLLMLALCYPLGF